MAADDGDFEDAAWLHEIRDGGVLFVSAGETEVMLTRSGDAVLALGANCTHAFASLRDARIEDGTLVCARHGARFDLATGRALGGGCPDLPVFTVRLRGARVLVRPR